MKPTLKQFLQVHDIIQNDEECPEELSHIYEGLYDTLKGMIGGRKTAGVKQTAASKPQQKYTSSAAQAAQARALARGSMPRKPVSPTMQPRATAMASPRETNLDAKIDAKDLDDPRWKQKKFEIQKDNKTRTMTVFKRVEESELP